MFLDDLKLAFEERLKAENYNIRQLSLKTGVNNSTLNRLNSQKASLENIPVLTMQRLFPDMVVYFFGHKDVAHTNNGAIANGNYSTAVNTYVQPSDTINRSELENQILHADGLTNDERVKFLLLLRAKL